MNSGGLGGLTQTGPESDQRERAGETGKGETGKGETGMGETGTGENGFG